MQQHDIFAVFNLLINFLSSYTQLILSLITRNLHEERLTIVSEYFCMHFTPNREINI